MESSDEIKTSIDRLTQMADEVNVLFTCNCPVADARIIRSDFGEDERTTGYPPCSDDCQRENSIWYLVLTQHIYGSRTGGPIRTKCYQWGISARTLFSNPTALLKCLHRLSSVPCQTLAQLFLPLWPKNYPNTRRSLTLRCVPDHSLLSLPSELCLAGWWTTWTETWHRRSRVMANDAPKRKRVSLASCP